MNSFNNSLRYYLRGSVSIIVLTFLCVLPATAQMVPGAASPKPSEVLTNDGPLKAQLDDRSFVENAASSGLAEVEMAKLAKAKISMSGFLIPGAPAGLAKLPICRGLRNGSGQPPTRP